jgi:hypothetical protein
MRVRHVEWVGTGQRIADACRLRRSLLESNATYQDCRVRCNCPPSPAMKTTRDTERPRRLPRCCDERFHEVMCWATHRRVSAGVLNNLRRSALLRAEHGRANAFARGRRAPLADLSRRMTHSTPSYNIAARTDSGMLLVPMTGVRRSGLLGGAEPATTLI